jgi:hypothetical protein
MNYKDLSLVEFLNEIIENVTSNIDLNNYAKYNTDNFSHKPLKLMIEDVAHFANVSFLFNIDLIRLQHIDNEESILSKPISLQGYLQYFYEMSKTLLTSNPSNTEPEDELNKKTDLIRDTCNNILELKSVKKKVYSMLSLNNIYELNLSRFTSDELYSYYNLETLQFSCCCINNLFNFSDILLEEYNKFEIMTETDQIENRKMRVTTNAMVELLNKINVSKKNADIKKIAKLISAITGYSANTIRQHMTNPVELTARAHGIEIEKINEAFKNLNIDISIKYDKYR